MNDQISYLETLTDSSTNKPLMSYTSIWFGFHVTNRTLSGIDGHCVMGLGFRVRTLTLNTLECNL